MSKLDITNNAAAVDILLEKTDNPLHRQILENWRRHSLLEVAGRWSEILTPNMISADPEYKIYVNNTLNYAKGLAEVREFYERLTVGGHNVIVITDQHIVVNDGGFAQNAYFNQFYRGEDLEAEGWSGFDEDGWYIRRSFLVEFWPYDDRGILLGEYAAEMCPPEIIEIDPSEVITPEEARAALDPLVRPLPIYENRP